MCKGWVGVNVYGGSQTSNIKIEHRVDSFAALHAYGWDTSLQGGWWMKKERCVFRLRADTHEMWVGLNPPSDQPTVWGYRPPSA